MSVQCNTLCVCVCGNPLGWTFHAKGLWYSPDPAEAEANTHTPILTMIGSPNFGLSAILLSPPPKAKLISLRNLNNMNESFHATTTTGRRSVERDLESQVALLTEDPQLAHKLTEVVIVVINNHLFCCCYIVST